MLIMEARQDTVGVEPDAYVVEFNSFAPVAIKRRKELPRV